MLRKGPGVALPNTPAPSSSSWTTTTTKHHQPPKPPPANVANRDDPPIRGLLKLLRGQIRGADLSSTNAAVSVPQYRYHGPTLRESHTELQKKKRGRPKSSNDQTFLEYSKHTTTFGAALGRHKFVAFFVVQGITNACGNACYSPHTLQLRDILATDYHGVVTTFVLDVGGSGTDSSGIDEEIGGGDQESSFCRGTGFCLFPTTPVSISTTLALLRVTKIPSVVILDARSGRIVEQDAILALERNDCHCVINRWQCGNHGLTLAQQVGAVATCDCSHGPCCGGGGGCCVVQ